MTELLVRLFIRNSDKTNSMDVRKAYGILTSIVGIICNLFLFALKITIGIFIHSISVKADAFNNLSDAASGLIGFVGVKLANRPADKEHPFGHGRFEYIAAFIVAFLVLQVGFSCFQNAVHKIIKPQQMSFDLISVVILCISIFIKLWLGLFNRKLGKRVNSSVMKATATDAFGDMLITLVTVLAIIIEKVSGLMIDGYMGLIVSLFVLYAGFSIAKETIEPLLGEAVDPKLYEQITTLVESYEHIVGSHDLIVHNYGPTHTMASIHAEVPNHIDFEVAHETIDIIERDVKKELGIFLVIHMDPIDVKDEEVLELKKLVTQIVKQQDKYATIHDFRIVNEKGKANLVFDLVVDHSYSEEQEEEYVAHIIAEIAKIDEKYHCMITLEHSYH